MIRKLYRERAVSRWEIIEKDTVDEIIFRTTKTRNRLILELMARSGMRIGEVIKLKLKDIEERKLILREPKSGKEHEIVFLPPGKWRTGSAAMPMKNARRPKTVSFRSHMRRPG